MGLYMYFKRGKRGFLVSLAALHEAALLALMIIGVSAALTLKLNGLA